MPRASPPATRGRTATPGPDPQMPDGAPEELPPGVPAGTDPSPAEAAPGQPDAEERGPLRRCLVTRESLPKEAMIRFVLGPDRALVPDLAGRMPGRGMWLSARGDVLERALTRGAFMKAARGPVHPGSPPRRGPRGPAQPCSPSRRGLRERGGWTGWRR